MDINKDQNDQDGDNYYWYGTGKKRKIKTKDKKLVKSVLQELKKLNESDE